MKSAPPQAGIERIEACFAGHAFEPHRHDTYALGVTLRGVQSFGYRGTTRHSLAGQAFVLHPDELHDGRAGDAGGFRYRILYIAPCLIRDALGETKRALPFVRAAVSNDTRLVAAIARALADLDRPLEELQRDEILVELAEALAAADPSRPGDRGSALHLRAVAQARELLDAAQDRPVSSRELEAVTGLTRYAMARQFRLCWGTSPHRYLVQRRLDRARALIRGGNTLAEAAVASGFADQSHMTRHFKKAYGLSPGRWAAIAGCQAPTT